MGSTSDSFPYVSLYQVGKTWRATLASIDGRRLTRRLGVNATHARTTAARYSAWLQQWKGGTISTAKLLQLLGESLSVVKLVERYRDELSGRDRNAQYVADVSGRLTLLLDRAGVAQVKQFTVAAIARGIEDLRDNGGVDGAELSDQTLKHYQTAARQFAKWLARKQHVERDPLEHVEAVVVGERVHGRRSPTRLEAQLLIEYLWDLPRGKFKTSGRDRAMLYLMAMSSGLRVGEIRELLVGWLDRESRVLSVPGAVTKNDKDALQPLPAWYVDELLAWHAGGPRMFPTITTQPAATLRADQEAARAAWIAAAGDEAAERERRSRSETLVYRTSAGVFDFHALRHYFGTFLSRSGATVKDAQTLMRHSTPALTLGIYTHTEAERLRDVVEAAFADPRTTKGGAREAQAHRAAQ